MAKLVLSGRKTQDRRPVLPGVAACRFKVGRVYAIQSGRGMRSQGSLTVTDVRREMLSQISLADVKREGFRTTADFRKHWRERFGPYESEVWVITFVKGDATDRLRLLAARPSSVKSDYTDNPARALRGAGEEVGAKRQERYAESVRERDEAHRKELQRRAAAVIAEIGEHAGGKDRRLLREALKRVQAVR
jgi:hypothetical protein